MERITNEEKAKDILNCKYCTLGEKICFSPTETPCVHYRDIIKMAKWKDEQHEQEKQQLIDKACEEYCNGCDYMTCRKYNYDKLHCRRYVKFKKAMEE